jgi:hypothetical protein
MKKKRKQKPDIDQGLGELADRVLGLIESSRYDPAEQAQLADWVKRSQIALDVLEAVRQLDANASQLDGG